MRIVVDGKREWFILIGGILIIMLIGGAAKLARRISRVKPTGSS